MVATYRDDLGPSRLRRDALIGRWRDELGRVSHRVVSLRAARVGRCAFGACATGGGLLVFVLAVARLIVSGLDQHGSNGALTSILLATWPVAIAAYVLGRSLARDAMTKRLARSVVPTSDAHADIERLEGASPTRLACELAGRSEVGSTALPMIGLSMLLPLTLHFVVALLASHQGVRLAGYDEWICASVLFAGHSHLVLAGMCWHFARKWSRLPGDEPARGWVTGALAALGLSAAVAMIPTVIFAPILVVVTGLLPVLLMFYSASRGLAEERRLLARESPA